MLCELCGKSGELYKTEIEGSQLNVCGSCSKYGIVISKVQNASPVQHKKEAKLTMENEKDEKEIVYFIVDNYASMIKRKREELGLRQEELAKQINEKSSVLNHLESGKLKPSLKLAKKLEKFLKIKLIDEQEVSKGVPVKHESGNGLTIGDMIKLK